MKVAVVCQECQSQLMLEEAVAQTIEKCPVCGAAIVKSDAAATQAAPQAQAASPVETATDAQATAKEEIVQEETEKANSPDDFEIVFGVLKKYKGKGGDVEVPWGVTTIDPKAFFNIRKLNSVTFPETLRSIGEKAFFGCDNLTEIHIPAGVTSIGVAAFIGSKIEKFTVDPKNKYFKDDGGNLYSKDHSVLVQYAIGKTAAKVLLAPSVKKIGSYAFFDCRALQTLVMPMVAEIGDEAFYNCMKLANLEKAHALKIIGKEAFAYCKKLVEFIPSEKLHSIGVRAFEHCVNLEKVFVGSGMERIGENAFLDCEALMKVGFAFQTGWSAGGEALPPTLLRDEKKAAKLLRETYVGVEWLFAGKQAEKKGEKPAQSMGAFHSGLLDIIDRGL
ncbi:MAG: leucine-rich repeat protein [Clostridia bacterium]|nr:leucine-rich repeat protein [Clostridia bacterium]